MKVLSIVGSRPQFIKLKPVDAAIKAAGAEHFIIHTGQHYDSNMSDVFFKGLSLPAIWRNLEVGSGSHGEQTADAIRGLEATLIEMKPDWLLIYGDTNATLAGAIVGAKLAVPVAHIEAGLRSLDRSMPEEINRIVADHVSDVLFAPTASAVDNLRDEGLATRAVLVGDVMADLLLSNKSELPLARSGLKIQLPTEYVVSTIHRQSNTDNPATLRTLIHNLASMSDVVYLVVHPRLRNVVSNWGIDLSVGNIRTLEPLGYMEMLSLVQGAKGLITDSGGLQKEAFLLGIPTITLRSETEWPETIEGDMNVLDPLGENLRTLISRNARPPKLSPFGEGDAAQRIVHYLQAEPVRE